MSAVAVIGAFVSALSLQSCPPIDGVAITGFAYDASLLQKYRQGDGNEQALVPRYCEYHRFSKEGSQVEYRQMDSQVIAEKRLIYQNINKLTPELIQTDFRFDELRSAKRDKNGWQVTYSGPDREREKNKKIDANDVDIVDAGFDYAIKQRWATLLAGDATRFSFLSVPHLRPIVLEASKQTIEKCIDSAAADEDGDLVCFWVEPKSALLRWVTSPLKLTYDRVSKRLLVFEGAVNILDENRKTREALIIYQYHDRVSG